MYAKTLVFLSVIAGLSSVAFGQEGYITEHMDGAPRTDEIGLVVIHATGGPDCNSSRSFKSGTLSGIVQHFRRNRDKISVHYIIGRDGTIVRMVPEDRVAWHVRGHNGNSIGIELINNGDGKDPYPAVQIDSLAALLAEIMERHHLGIRDIRGHSELDDSELDCNGKRIKRKQDPGENFPWNEIRLRLSS